MSESKTIKSDQEWREELTPEQYEVCRNKGTERHLAANTMTVKTPGCIAVVAVGQSYLILRPNSIPVPAGPVSTNPWMTIILKRKTTTVMGCNALR